MIPLIVAARDEERAIGACLDSLIASARGCDVEIVVALDDCRDDTERVVAARGIRAIRSTGGKVRAQQAGLAAFASAVAPAPMPVSTPMPMSMPMPMPMPMPTPMPMPMPLPMPLPSRRYAMFCDADVVVDEATIPALVAAMRDPAVRVAVPPKQPLPPRRAWSPLARALHRYNMRRGFHAHRPAWFSGKLFAMRDYRMPDEYELATRAARIPPSPFYGYTDPLRVDDVYLSRIAAGAIVETTEGRVHFRAPETLRGMYRYYRRMRRELERIDALFPELPATRDPVGAPVFASLADRAAYHAFHAALVGCRAAYRAERFAVDAHLFAPRDPWPAISETK